MKDRTQLLRMYRSTLKVQDPGLILPLTLNRIFLAAWRNRKLLPRRRAIINEEELVEHEMRMPGLLIQGHNRCSGLGRHRTLLILA